MKMAASGDWLRLPCPKTRIAIIQVQNPRKAGHRISRPGERIRIRGVDGDKVCERRVGPVLTAERRAVELPQCLVHRASRTSKSGARTVGLSLIGGED
jgi:hypothetical protein